LRSYWGSRKVSEGSPYDRITAVAEDLRRVLSTSFAGLVLRRGGGSEVLLREGKGLERA